MKLSYKYRTFDVPLCALRCLKRRMRYVRAAGGIVTDDAGNMLLIRRNNRWDLPKGKVEAGETLLQAALREVEEETGLRVSSVQCSVFSEEQCSVFSSPGAAAELNTKHLTLNTEHCSLNTEHLTLNTVKTYHIFNLYGGWHLKQTSWFPMHAAGNAPQGTGQQEEGITDVVWVKPDEWHRRLETSYGTLKTLSLKWIH